MILDNDLLMDSISNQKLIGKLIMSSVGKLLDDYKVNDYVSTDKIPEIKLDGTLMKSPASSFFERYQYITSFEIDEILSLVPSEFANEFKAHKRFPFPHTVHFFDTFIVSEIMPYSLETEFLIISPDNKESEGLDFISGMFSGGAITALFSAIARDPGAQLALYIKIDQLLEYLRTGQGRKKLFGIF